LEDRLKPKLDQALADMVQQFESAEDTTRNARAKSEKCRDYFDDKQLTAEEESTLKKRGQPPVVFNEIKPKVKTMLGLEKQTRKDPKAFPRNPDDEDASRAATDSIRYVCDDSMWDDKRSAAAKNLAVEGTAAVKIGFKQSRQGTDPDITRVRWDRLYHDPHSAEDDFADASYMGEVVWMDLDRAKAKFRDAADILDATWRQAQNSDTYDDTPKHGLWADYKRRRVRLCEHYYREGDVWMFCIFTKAGFAVEPQESPYLDADGVPECPIKAISLYVDRDNNRYGEVQAMLSPQDEINKRRSKALHLINSRQVRVSPNVAADAASVRKELSRPDGVFIGEQGDVEVLPTNDMAQGNLNLLLDAREHIHRTGANSAMAGKDTNRQSGKAIALQQMGGMTEAADFLDCIRRLSLAVYRSVWGRIRQAWPAERWVRVTDNDKNVRFVGLNKPITALHAMAKQMGVDKDQLPQLQEAAQSGDPQAGQILQQLQAFAADPRSQQVVGIENNVGELDVDIIVDEGMDTPTIEAEQFDTVAKMLPGAPPALQGPLWKMMIASSALRGKEQLEEAMNQPPSPQQQQAEKVQMAGAVAEVEKTNSETAKNYAQAQAADPAAQMIQLEREKAGAQIDLQAEKQQHGMALAERKQAFGEHMSERQSSAREVA
jgi:hypothetical protein